MKGDPLRGRARVLRLVGAREWWAPLRADRRVFRRNALVAALDKSSEFAGRAMHEWSAQVFRDDEGTVLRRPVPHHDPHRTQQGAGDARSTTRSNRSLDTDEQIAEIDAQYARRSAARRRTAVVGRRRTRATRSARW